MDLAACANQGQYDSERLLMSAISSIAQEAKRLETMSVELFYELAQICWVVLDLLGGRGEAFASFLVGNINLEFDPKISF